LAIEATYSELYLSPGLSVINALILNIGGRPNTSLIGNGVLLAAAVSMANSLGLNRSPLDWDIPQPEKYLRMKIWWALLVHDRWYGYLSIHETLISLDIGQALLTEHLHTYHLSITTSLFHLSNI
jgi:hypothetical protein